jgi:hypothetical protein
MPVLGFTADDQIGFAIDDFAQALAHKWVVIDQQDAGAFLGRRGSA